MPAQPGGARKIWTVTELNRAAGELLEEAFPRVWVEGEVSNWKLYPSGHAYFSLKDDGGQVSAVLFRAGSKVLRFTPKDGLAVLALGRVSLYSQRGQYQLIVEELEPKGKGALQLAFEQLREKLQREGLFDAARKRPLPALPRAVGVVTSPTGAVIRDILTVLGRRFPNLRVLLNPVRVQGEGAAAEIAAAIAELDRRGDVDALIVGRGGGSMEDLWAFNEEVVARAIAACSVPVISAVGHETDFTIADFVADLRAPTPSAAAELVVESKEALAERIETLARRLRGGVATRVGRVRHRLDALAVRRMFGDRRRRLLDLAQRVDGLAAGLARAGEGVLAQRRGALGRLAAALAHLSPRARWALLRARLLPARVRLAAAGARTVGARRERVTAAGGRLEALSPLGVLGRGYSICRRLPGREVVTDAAAVAPGADIEVLLRRGTLRATVTAPGEAG
ncbi:MAG TPA: exodeoxyribonuclease VII large subunit [Candidatus Methanoperedens sp.]|nr:exodeoxyribonuclease VII large subunit [Candidatus Methanoperedens sp.]